MHSRTLVAVTLFALTSLAIAPLMGQQVTKEDVTGIRNLYRLETTVACAGAVTPDAIPEIRKMGFVSIINLRLATETGADVENHAAAAKAAGLKYFHVPFAGKPDPNAADQFIAAITSPGAEPAFIHCAGGNRAATMWLIKRLVVDGWDAERANQEAIALGQTNEAMRQWAADYAKARRANQTQQPAAAVFAPDAGEYKTADIRVLTPGVVFSSGLPDIAAAFTKEHKKTVGINTVGMGTIVDEMKTRTPPPDVIVLPFQLMNSLALEGGVMPGTMVPLGRNRMGLAVRAGAPKPDISTPEKFVAALKTAKAVMRSNPASRTMVATIIDDMLKRPEFAGVNAPPSTKGEGGQALARGEGDMAIQTISQILPYKEIELVGPVPREYGLWIDTMVAVSARATHPDDARALIRYLLRPESNKVWKPRGMERLE